MVSIIGYSPIDFDKTMADLLEHEKGTTTDEH